MNDYNHEKATVLFESAVALFASILDGESGYVRDEFRGATWGAIHRHLESVAGIITSLSGDFGDGQRETYECIRDYATARALGVSVDA
jgi:hypothetical protein